MSQETPNIVERVKDAALSTIPTMVATHSLCRAAINDSIPGAFVECGVFGGAQTAIMASVIAEFEPNGGRKVHLFDSFEGIPEAGPNDDETITNCIGDGKEGRLVSTGVSVCSIEKVREHMKQWGIDDSLLVYHPGWFQDTTPRASLHGAFMDGIALLRLDGDLYESTNICLTFLARHVCRGGYIIVDDYALTGCRKAVDEWLEQVYGDREHWPKVIEIEGGGGPVWFKT